MRINYKVGDVEIVREFESIDHAWGFIQAQRRELNHLEKRMNNLDKAMREYVLPEHVEIEVREVKRIRDTWGLSLSDAMIVFREKQKQHQPKSFDNKRDYINYLTSL